MYPASVIDIYDFSTQAWSSTNFNIGRSGMAAATVGNIILFAGGGVPGGWTTQLDIYDAATNTISPSNQPGISGMVSVAIVGNKAFFAGNKALLGTVDVYDASTGVWSEMKLSQPRAGITATAAGDKVYFAGGWNGYSMSHPSNVVDIYDNATGTWSTSTLSVSTGAMASIYADGKIYWAGGAIGYSLANDDNITTCKVEIRDVGTGSSSFTNLSRPTEFYNNFARPVYYNSKIIFQTGYNLLNIYDPQRNTWSTGRFPQNTYIESLILVNHALYGVGFSSISPNYLSDHIWKLEF